MRDQPVKARLGDLDPTERSCEQCGHPLTEHLMCANGRPPTEGWIECPVPECACRSTWSLSPDDAAQLRMQHALNARGNNDEK